MFNDIDKKLRFTFLVNLILGPAYAWFTAKYVKVVLEYDKSVGTGYYWIPKKYLKLAFEQGQRKIPMTVLDASVVNRICLIFAIICIVVALLSLWVCIALTFDKRKPFKWLSKIAKPLRIFAWIALIGGWALSFCFCFWTFFHTSSDNFLVDSISYTFISIIPLAALVFCFAAFWYGLGNAADGGDATYVKNSKLFDMETLHGENDTRKRCPDCGTRTDRHSCPNCGAWIE